MVRLLAEARARYDAVIIDAPPLVAVSDASVLAPHVDGVVLVARWGKTTTTAAADAAEALRTVSARLLGSVLTMVHGRGHVEDEYLATSVGTQYAVGPWSVSPPFPPPLPEPGRPESPTAPVPPARTAQPRSKAAVLASTGQSSTAHSNTGQSNAGQRPSPRPRPRPEEG
jgi:hypothetical protein